MSDAINEFARKIPVGLFAVDGSNVLLLNEYMNRLTGFSDKEISEEKFWRLIHGDEDKVRKEILDGTPTRFIFGRKNKKIWVEYRGTISTRNGKRTVFGCLIEVTSNVAFDEKRSAVVKVSREMKVASSRDELYSLAMDFTKDVLGYRNCAILERDGDYLKVVRERGYDKGTYLMKLPLSGKGVTTYVFNKNESYYVPDVLKAEEYIEGVPGARCEYALPITFKDEKYGVFDVQNDEVDSITYPDRILLNTLVSEMATVLKGLRTLEQLKESESRYRILVETAKEGIIKVDPDENILFANQSLSDLTGYDVNELIGMDSKEITTEEQFKLFRQKTAIRKKGLRDSYEAVIVHKNGNILDVIVSAAPFNMPDGKFGGTFAIMTDITKMKEAERKAEFYHSLLRHDIGNKNQIIMGYIELLMDTKLDKEQKKLLDIAYKAINSSNRLIKKVKEIQVASEDQDYFAIDLDAVLRRVIGELSSESQKKSVKIHYKPIKVSVTGNELMGEIFSNVIGNAIMHSGGKNINITGKAGSKYVTILIEDDGIGIPDYIRKSMFDMKVKGKESKGSGLGLYLVKAMVDGYGGNIELKDRKEGGAVFEVRLRKWENK